MTVGYNAFEKEKNNYSHYQKNDVYDSVRVPHPLYSSRFIHDKSSLSDTK